MKLSYVKSFFEYTFLLGKDDCYIGVNSLGIHILDKKTFEEKDSLIDFFGAGFGFLSYDKNYLVLGNPRLGINVYDLTKLEKVGSYLPTMKGLAYLMGMDIMPDQKGMYVVVSSPSDKNVPPVFFDEFLENSNISIKRLSFPELTEEETIPVTEKISDFSYIPFMKKYVTLSNKGDYYFFDGKNLEKTGINTRSKDIICFDDHKYLGATTDISIRFYDEHQNEQDKIDIISDEKRVVPANMFGYMDGMGFDENQNTAKEVYNEKVDWIRPLDKDHFVAVISDSIGTYQRIQIMSYRTGSVVAEQVLGQIINNPSVLDETHISFFCNAGLVIMEVKHD